MKDMDFFKSPVQGFLICKIDASASPYNYYMFENIYGNYYILRENLTTKVYDWNYMGKNTISKEWTSRTTLVYSKPSVAFAALVE